MSEKDMALLDSSLATCRTDSIIERIHRIEVALQEGEKMYTAEELKRLRGMLEEYLQLLKAMVE